LTSLNQTHFGEHQKIKTYQCLDQASKGLEAIIERGGEQKEDLQEDF
jgi:hypothetical protein